MLPNWFIAIPVAETAIVEALPPAPHGLRLFGPADLHLTVAFLGPVGEARARTGFTAMDWALAPREISFGAVVPMGSARRYSALAAMLVEGRHEVETAMGQARGAAFAGAGIEGERRPPLAHLTLARPLRRASDSDRAAALGWAQSIDLSGIRVRIEGIALYTWAADRLERLFQVVAQR